MTSRLFSPATPITRGQLATALASTLQLKQTASPAQAFSDVPAGTLLATSIRSAVTASLITPVSATAFNPGDPVSRQDLAVALTRGFGLTSPAPPTVSDAQRIVSIVTSSVAAVLAKGYLSAFPDNTFRPAASVTREEAARAIYMAFYDHAQEAAQKAQ